MYNAKSPIAGEFIGEREIIETLKYADDNKTNRSLLEETLAAAALRKGLNHRQAALLLSCGLGDVTDAVFSLAREIKRDFYGNRVVIFAPLYLSNYCVNGCSYCPYHGGNTTIPRRILTIDEIKNEVAALQDMGHKRLAVECGEDYARASIDYVIEAIGAIYSVKSGNGAIRRVNVNIAATTVENYARLKDAGIGTYILFQETYDKKRYESLHRYGPKADYDYHTTAHDRAMTGGVDDVGLGALFGLSDYHYDVIGLMCHAEHLESAFGVGPHTVSVPRIRPADGVDAGAFVPVDDAAFERIVAVLRLSLPYAGIIISTRESVKSRERALELGASQLSGGSRTGVGSYSDTAGVSSGTEQFDIDDGRTLDEIASWLLEQGHIPSFCTACYRAGRTGDRFMSLVKSGKIADVCRPNAIMTLSEYLRDYAGDKTRSIGERVIERELADIKDERLRETVARRLTDIENGERDFRV